MQETISSSTALLTVSAGGGPDTSFGTIWWMVTILLSAIAGIVLQRTSDRWFRPLEDYELWVDYTATPLFPSFPKTATARFGYLVDGMPVDMPYQVRLWVWRAGPRDVRADSFSHDLVVRLGVPVVASTVRADEHASGAAVSFEAGDRASWRLRPSIVRADFWARYDFVSDGLPDVQTHNPVADLRVSSFYDEIENRNLVGSLLAIAGGILLAGGIIAAVTGVVLTLGFGFDVGGWIQFALMAPIAGIAALASSSEAKPRRARLARKQLNERGERYALRGRQIEIVDTVFVPRKPSP